MAFVSQEGRLATQDDKKLFWKIGKGRIGISVTFPQFHSQQNILYPTHQLSVNKAPREHLNCILVFSFIVFQGFTV